METDFSSLKFFISLVLVSGIFSGAVFLVFISPLIGTQKVQDTFEPKNLADRVTNPIRETINKINISEPQNPSESEDETQTNYCGNAVCTLPENCYSCAIDCGQCPRDCSNQIKDGIETDVDCGGNCTACENNKQCTSNNDCVSKNCSLGICIPQEPDEPVTQTCNELGGQICSTNNYCTGTIQSAIEGACCTGTCNACIDSDGDNFFSGQNCGTQADCNDSSSTIFPGATETCDLADNDCDGQINEGLTCFLTQCNDGKDNDGDGKTDASDTDCSSLEDVSESLTGNGFYGMEILSVSSASQNITVTITGAKYVLSPTGMELWRRIDPATNTVNPKKVAALSFNSNLGQLEIISADSRSVKISTQKIDFEFMQDSMFFLTAKSSLNYDHRNLILGALWNKGTQTDRIWTDGYGGSLHAKIAGNMTATNTTDSTTFSMQSGDKIGHMVFPPKKFDFEGLYGQNAKPFVFFTNAANLSSINSSKLLDLKNQGFGAIMIWNTIYDITGHNSFCTLSTGKEEDSEPYCPVQLSGNIIGKPGTTIMGYKLKENLKEQVKQVIGLAHQNGMKVIPYLHAPRATVWKNPANNNNLQDFNTTLEWMRAFQREYNFDGWYFDNAAAGSTQANYDFIKQARQDVGDNGILFHHDSVDVWDWAASPGNATYSGLRAIMVNAYVNYTLTGETGEMAKLYGGPNDTYLRFFSSGYGLSQAFGMHKIRSFGDVLLRENEKDRVMAQNLNTADSHYYDNAWRTHFKPFYDMRKNEFNSANFDPDVSWPLNQNTDWYKTMAVQFEINGSNTVFSWSTPEQTSAEIAITSNGSFGYGNGPDVLLIDDSLAAQHSIPVTNLKPDTFYQFRVISSNKKTGAAETVWYANGNFTSGAGTVQSCNNNLICETNESTQNCPSDCHLLGEWDFDNGSTLLDKSGNGFFANNFGATWQDCGSDSLHPSKISGGCYYFNGTDNYLSLPTVLNGLALYDPLGNGVHESTVMAWIKPENLARYNSIARYLGGFSYFSAGTTDKPGKLRTMVFDGQTQANFWPTSTQSLSQNEWNHVAFVFKEPGEYTFYINGQNAGSEQKPSLVFSDYSATQPLIGFGFPTETDNGFFKGFIDDVRVYNKALTTQEISDIIN